MKNQIDNHAGQKLISRDDKSSENHLGEKGGLDLRVLIENADSIKAQSSAEKHGDMRISPEKNFNIVIDLCIIQDGQSSCVFNPIMNRQGKDYARRMQKTPAQIYCAGVCVMIT